jgi:hypothetical protein
MRSDDAMPHTCRRLSADIPNFMSHIHDEDAIEGRPASNINSRQDRSGIDNLWVHSILIVGNDCGVGREEGTEK